MKNRLLSLTLVLIGITPLHAQTLHIAMTGDIMMGTTFPSIMLPANDGRDLFRDARDVLTGADLTVGNLEGAICAPSAHPPATVIC